MDPDAVLEVVEDYIISGVFEVFRVDIGCDEGPWSLDASEERVDATGAGANVETNEFTSWLTVGG